MPTIGVSLAVPAPWGEELQQHRISFGDEAARLIPTHVTLLAPLLVDDAEYAGIGEHLEHVAKTTSPFRVHLRGTGTFRPLSPVVFLNVVAGISDCEQLADAVLAGPLTVVRAFPYHPHVTVAHHLDEAGLDHAFDALADYEAEFGVEEMWMYRHDSHLGWQPERSFRFEG